MLDEYRGLFAINKNNIIKLTFCETLVLQVLIENKHTFMSLQDIKNITDVSSITYIVRSLNEKMKKNYKIIHRNWYGYKIISLNRGGRKKDKTIKFYRGE